MEGLKTRSEGATVTLTLSRPERGNSLSAELVEALHEALDEAERDGTRLLILRGEGKHFCTGFDLTDFESQSEGDLLARFVRIEMLLARVWRAPFATMAIAQGRCFGAGADLYAACATRIATPDALFAFPGAAFGLILGTRRLGERIGAGLAEGLVSSGRIIDASEALRLRLAGEVMAADAIAEAQARAERSATRLEPATFAAMRGILSGKPEALDADLAALTRSAARPGLKRRICAYRTSMQARGGQGAPARDNSGG